MVWLRWIKNSETQQIQQTHIYWLNNKNMNTRPGLIFMYVIVKIIVPADVLITFDACLRMEIYGILFFSMM